MSLSQDDPITKQAEQRYYFLSIYLYFLRSRLIALSEEIVDEGLTNLSQARAVHNSFNKLRNQYWFKTITTDFQSEFITGQLKDSMNLDAIYSSVATEISEYRVLLMRRWLKVKSSHRYFTSKHLPSFLYI